MNIQNLIVCDSKNIFDILFEIKEELNCNLIFKTKKDLLNTKNLQNYMILSESIIENLDNQILIDNLPMKINTLIEKINMSFLKKN